MISLKNTEYFINKITNCLNDIQEIIEEKSIYETIDLYFNEYTNKVTDILSVGHCSNYISFAKYDYLNSNNKNNFIINLFEEKYNENTILILNNKKNIANMFFGDISYLDYTEDEIMFAITSLDSLIIDESTRNSIKKKIDQRIISYIKSNDLFYIDEDAININYSSIFGTSDLKFIEDLIPKKYDKNFHYYSVQKIYTNFGVPIPDSIKYLF